MEDRDAAEKEFGKVFDDENLKKSLKTSLKKLGHMPVEDSTAQAIEKSSQLTSIISVAIG